MSTKTLKPWSRMAIAFFLMGMLSATLLVWINKINTRQDENFLFADMIMDIQLRTATSHLWLEEIFSGDSTLEVEKIWADMDQAISLADALLKGGQSEHGMDVQPLHDPVLRSSVEALGTMLVEFRSFAVERYMNPRIAGIGTESDQRFDDLFREILHKAKGLETLTEKRQILNKAESERLFVTILVVWTSVVVVAAIGLWTRESKKTLAEEALRKANEELELRVEERTRELSTANRHLQSEIAERTRAEEGIRLYEEVVKHMPVGLYVWRKENDEYEERFELLAANPVAVQATATEDGPGTTMTESFLGKLETDIPRIYREITRSGSARELDKVYHGDERSGECFFSVKAFPLPNRCIGVMFENTTERKRAENALRESESKFRSLSREFQVLLEAIPDSITLLSPELVMLWSNRGAAKTTAGDSCDAGEKFCYRVRYGLDIPCGGCPTMLSYITGRPETATVSASDGTYWDVRAFPIRNEEGRITKILELAGDITERIALQAEAMRAGHLASIGELAAGVAHEINNPVNGIINYAEILSEESREGSRENTIANRIIKEGVRIAGIVSGLLSFARDRSEEKGPVRVDSILSDALALTELQLRKNGIRPIIDVPPDLPEINVNPQQIQQVFLNIINNARYALNAKYPTEHEGKVLEISCENTTVDGSPLLRIIFTDHGVGIPADIVDKIMNPFFSTKPVGKGTGLGLSISHGIIADHGGKLSVDSSEGEFTKVVILLPTVESDHG